MTSYFKIENKNNEDLVSFNLSSIIGKAAFAFAIIGVCTATKKILSCPVIKILKTKKKED